MNRPRLLSARTFGRSLLLLVCLFCASLQSPLFAQKRTFHVLVLHSYSIDYQWTADIHVALKQQFDLAGLEVELYSEFLDAGRFFERPHQNEFESFLKEKYSSFGLDLVLVSDNEALKFYRDSGVDIFPGVPMVFMGINYYRPSKIKGLEAVTGVVEQEDFEANINLILSLHPEIKNLVAVTDYSRTGSLLAQRLFGLVGKYKDRVNLLVLPPLSKAELLQRLASLKTGDVVLYTFFYRDRLGETIDYKKSVQLITQAAPVPVYAMWDYDLGQGVVGGMMTSGYLQGKRGGEMAAAVLEGTPAWEIPIQEQSPNRYMFDHDALKRHRIPIEGLPLGAHIINEPVNLLKTYENQIRLTLSFMALLLGIILMLLKQIKDHNRTKEALEESYDQLEKKVTERTKALNQFNISLQREIRDRAHAEALLTENQERLSFLSQMSQEGLAISRRGRFVDCNQAMTRIFGYTREELLGMGGWELAPPDQQEMVKKRIDSKAEVSAEMSGLTKWGEIIPLDVRARMVSHQGEELRVTLFFNLSRIRKAEAELKKNRDLLRDLMENSTNAVVIRDLKGRLIMANQAFMTFSGHEGLDLTGRLLEDFWPLEAVKQWEKEDKEILETGQGKTFEKALHLSNKDFHVVESRFPLLDSSREIYALCSIVTDISERIKMEQAIQRNARTLRQMFEEHSAIMLLVDPQNQGKILNANKAAVEFYGYSHAELTGSMHITDLNILSLEEVKSRMELSRKKLLTYHQFRHKLKNGQVREVEVHSTPVTLETGPALFSIIHDITERKEMENRVKESEERFKLLANVAFESLLVTKEGRILDVNHAGENLLQASREAMVGKPLEDFLAPFEASRPEILELLNANDPKPKEIRGRRPNGQDYYLEVRPRTLALPDGELRITALNDITHIRQVEKEVQEHYAFLQSLIAVIPSPMFFKKLEGSLIGCNQAFLDYFHLSSQAEVAGRDLEDIFDPAFVQTFKEERNQVVAQGKTRRREANLRLGQDEREVILNLSLYEDASGQPDGLVGIIFDVTDRQRALKRLEEVQERLDRAITGSQDGIWDWDLIHNETYLSPRGYEILGYEPDQKEITFSLIREILLGRDFRQIREIQKEILKDKQTRVERVLRFYRPDGHVVFCHIRALVEYNQKRRPIRLSGAISDITPLKQAEEQLRVNQEHNQALLDAMPDMMFRLDRDGYFLDCKIPEGDFFGFSPEGLIGYGLHELPLRDDLLDNLLDALSTAFETGNLQVCEYSHNIQNQEATFEARLVRSTDTEVFMVVRDITEQKRSEKALREIQERLDLVIRGSQAGIWDWDMKSDEIYFSTRLKEMCGYAEAELENSLAGLQRVLMEEDFVAMQEQIGSLEEAGIDRFEALLRFRHKSNRVIYTDSRAILLFDENKRAFRMSGASLDISQLKETELELEKSKERLDLALKGGDLGLWDWNIQSGHLVFNHRMAEMLGQDLGNLAQHIDSWVKLIHPDDLDRMMGHLDTHLSGATTYFESEHRMKHRNGSWIWVLDRGQVVEFDKEGRPLRLVGTHLDITERKLQEKALREAKEHAETADRAKSEFLANMSHEIRTPMNAVLGFTELLDNMITEPTQKGYLEAIKKGGKSLLTLINDILDLSKIEAGRMEMNFEMLNLRELFGEIVQIFSVRTREKDLQLTLSLDPRLPDLVYIDDIRLRQVLFNLMGNAVKFTGEGGISLEIHRVNQEPNPKTLDLEIVVADTGIGINPDSLEQIFETFRQQEGHNTKKYGGTGLGLAITKKLVTMMGGVIRVESQVGKGSKFIIHLPNLMYKSLEQHGQADAGIPMPNPQTDWSQITLSPAKILLVDDLPQNRLLLRSALKRHPLTIFEAGNGEQALEIMSKSIPDLVLMDLRMPVMGGKEATQLLRQNPKLKNIPVIAITASVMHSPEDVELQQLFDAYLSKPIHVAELFQALARFLSYSTKEDQEQVKPSLAIPSLNQSVLEQLPQLVQELEGDYQQTWQKVRAENSFDDIYEFALSLTKLGKSYHYPALEEYGKSLSASADSFDIENVTRLLEDFPLRISEIKGLAGD